jgi:lipid-A-disaccharide synthase
VVKPLRVPPLKIMLVAGEPSGDQLAAELVTALRSELATRFPDQEPVFFGAGGPKMAAAGVTLRLDLTQHSVIGLIEVLKRYRQFKRIFDDLVSYALEQRPDVVIGVDFGGFNLRFAKALKTRIGRATAPSVGQADDGAAKAAAGQGQGVAGEAPSSAASTPAARQEMSSDLWRPKLVQFVSPQVWASRPGRAGTIAATHDLLLSIFPFEKAWYAKRHPKLKVEFVGHPAADRFAGQGSTFGVERYGLTVPDSKIRVLVLPGSRLSELKRHLPVVLAAAKQLRAQTGCDVSMVLPNEALMAFAMPFIKAVDCTLEIQTGGLEEELRRATVAIASTGTVTMECAYFGVPTVALYKTSWSTYQIGKRIVTVKYLAMPNILADEIVFPEFIQSAATPENLAAATLELLNNPRRRQAVQETLGRIVRSLGEPGAARRAATAVADLL